MNELQTLLAIVFSIYFATTVATSGRFLPFDSTAALAGDVRALFRLVLAFLMLNVLPFLYFMWILGLLDQSSGELVSAWREALGVLFAGLGGFGIYRLFISIVLLQRRGRPGRYVFYSHPDDLPAVGLKAGAEHKQPPEDAVHYGVGTIALGGLIWVAVCLGGFFLLTICGGKSVAA